MTDEEKIALADQARAKCAQLLAKSTTEGYIIDRTILSNFITQFTQDTAQMNTKLTNDIRQIMQWPPQPDLIDDPDPTTQQESPTQPSLLEFM